MELQIAPEITLEIALIRHGQADAKRLIGMTDEPLDAAAKLAITAKRNEGAYPDAERVYSSGLLRCFETAKIIYETKPVEVLNDFRALDYGDFDGMARDDLAKSEAFLKWAAVPATRACPNGEEPYAFTARSKFAFRRICEEAASEGYSRVAVVTHKTVIQTILQRYLIPSASYAECEISHGCGFVLRYSMASSAARVISIF